MENLTGGTPPVRPLPCVVPCKLYFEEGEERKANNYRSQVLRFNNELVRGLGHTEEDYDEILEVIWKYNEYCKTHPKYKNNKMPHAIKNVERMYDEMLRTNGFLKTEE